MLALIAGRGGIPGMVVAAQEKRPLICALEGSAPDELTPDIVFRLEQLGSFLVTLGERGVSEICMVGSIDRPALDPALLDEETKPLVPLITGALAAGDDAALRAVMGLFEQTGFALRAAHELAPDLIAPPGVLSEKWPDGQMRRDAARGAALLAELAAHDVGQCCVVGGGQVLGIEAMGGTDHMLETLPQTPLRARAVLIKAPKIGQDRRADLPTVGPETIERIVQAGLAGLVVDAGDVFMVDRAEMIARADAAGLVLWSRTGE